MLQTNSSTLLLAVLTLLMSETGYAFQSFQLPKLFQPPTNNNASRKQKEQMLLDSISNTENGKSATLSQQREILNLVSNLEQTYTPPSLSKILEDEPDLIDGTWFLQYTSPSNIEDLESDNSWTVENAEDKIEVREAKLQGSVSAAGINVDVSSKTPRQVFDLEKSTVMNEVILDNGLVRVGGPFRLSENKGNRAVVSFVEGTVELNNLFLLGDVKVDLSPIFGLRAMVSGTKENGWLETTYLSSDVRIGRGNKGTCFVLTRDASAVVP